VAVRPVRPGGGAGRSKTGRLAGALSTVRLVITTPVVVDQQSERRNGEHPVLDGIVGRR
jgi:hypothetical protein